MVKKIGTVVRASSSSLATNLCNKSTAPDLIITIERKESTQSIITLLSIQGLMYYLAVFLIVYGAFLLIGMFLQFPFLYNNFKSKAMIQKMGKKAFQWILFGLAVIFIVVGILIMP